LEINLTGLESTRLHFRRLVESDFDNWLEFFQEPESWKYLHLTDDPDPKAQCQVWFDRTLLRYREKRGGMHVLNHTKTGELIGQCGIILRTVDDIAEVEVGYAIMPRFQRQGFATEAAETARDWAFHNLDFESVISMIHRDNHNSIAVAGKNGMIFDKETEYENVPVQIYRIDRSAWTNLNRKRN
jgi:RimJ/RimL family protein N-acetyltransferase